MRDGAAAHHDGVPHVRLVHTLQTGSSPGIGGPYSRQSKPVNCWLYVFKMAAIVVVCALIFIRLLV